MVSFSVTAYRILLKELIMERSRRDSNPKPVVLNYIICPILNQVIGLPYRRMSDPFCKLSLAYFGLSLISELS